MRRISALALLALLAPVLPLLGQETFSIAPTHSQVEFAVPFMGLTSVRGQFEDYSGVITWDPSGPERSSVTVVFRTESIHTGNDLRDRHLKSDDFFEVDRYPVMMFQSDRIVRTRNGFNAIGRLLMHGVTHPITLPFIQRHPLRRDPSGVDYLGFDAHIRLNWRVYGIAATSKHNSWFNPTTMLVNDSVDVRISIEADHRHISQLHFPALDEHLRRYAEGGVALIEQLTKEAKAKGPDSLRVFVRGLPLAADALLERGQFAPAIALHRLFVDAVDGDAEATAMLGNAYRVAGDRAQAIQTFKLALSRDPFQPDALEWLRRLAP